MNEVPRAFLARIAEHNRHCWLAALLSLVGAWLAWMLYAALFTGAVLLMESIRTGDTNILRPPVWFYPVGGGIVLVLLIVAAVDAWMRRYRPLSDRPIIGWHLTTEVLFLPARMTFAILDHIAARVVLSRYERAEAWRLLLLIWQMDRPSAALMSYDFPDPRQLSKLLFALQILGWIDLFNGDEDWYYKVRSEETRFLREMLPPVPQEE